MAKDSTHEINKTSASYLFELSIHFMSFRGIAKLLSLLMSMCQNSCKYFTRLS
jgi:hypothetical protein